MVSGYRYCACRDCPEIIVGEDGDFCDLCKAAGCPDYQGQERMSQECRRPDAYDIDGNYPDKRKALFELRDLVDLRRTK